MIQIAEQVTNRGQVAGYKIENLLVSDKAEFSRSELCYIQGLIESYLASTKLTGKLVMKYEELLRQIKKILENRQEEELVIDAAFLELLNSCQSGLVLRERLANSKQEMTAKSEGVATSAHNLLLTIQSFN